MKTLYESGENYLEAILILKTRKPEVRAVDVANYFSFSKASISRAVKILLGEGYIYLNAHGVIEFTEEGFEKAESVYERHKAIKEYFIKELGVSAPTAEEDACRIEHIISEETLKAIKNKLNS